MASPRKLTNEQVKEMRRRRQEEAWNYQELADHYGIHRTTASKICNYYRYIEVR